MILVTGGTGFIGSHLLEKLCPRGEAGSLPGAARTDTRRLPAGVETA